MWLCERMGNWLGSIWPDKGNDSSVEQPKIFGKLPPPYEINKIAPSLHFFSNSKLNVVVDHSHTPKGACDLLRLNKILDNADRVVIVTHGFRGDKNTKWLHEAVGEIFKLNQRQVVAVLGWGDGADIGLLRYSQAAANALETGWWLGTILAEVKSQFAEVELYGVGHSLGSHLMGVAGRTSKALDRITGLDPAGVGFQDENLDKRLNAFDAPLVDVIHTDGQDVPYFGTLVPLGKIDFYPNYGWNQPTIDRSFNHKPDIEVDSNNRKVAQPSPLGGAISDSHGRAVEYFLWSIAHKGAFRTQLQLESDPDVEHAVHRVKRTHEPDDIEVEMGFHTDQHLECKMRAHRESQQPPCGGSVSLKPRSDEYTRYDRFAGCYYVHTNGRAPWS